MTPELTDKLLEKYPEQFKNLKGIECDDGWYDLLDRLFYVVKNRMDYAQRINKPLESFGWVQIKEKFSGLRAYSYGSDDYINGAITMAESVSYMTCEVTGEKGKLRKQKISEGEIVPAWMKTLCDSEAQKQGYVL